MINPSANVQFKDLPNFQSMFGNIGNSWDNTLPNDLYIKGVPKNVFKETNFTGNVGLGLDTLRTFTFPANTFRRDQFDYLRVTAAGSFAANDDNKRIKLSFGGNELYNSGSADLDDFGYYIDLVIFRLSNTNFNAGMIIQEGQIVSDSAATVNSSGDITTARNNSIITLSGGSTFSGSSQTLLLEAESETATNNNIINNIWVGELVRF